MSERKPKNLDPADSDATTRGDRTRQASAARREQARKGTQELILEEARSLLASRGYANFSLREVAEHIGYSPTTIYRYFENKDALVSRILRGGFGEFNTRLNRALESETEYWPKLQAAARAYVRFALERPQHYRLMFMDRCDLFVQLTQDEGAPPVEVPKAGLHAVRDTIADGMAAGVLREGDAERWSHFFWVHLHGITALHIGHIGMSGFLGEEWVDGMVEQMDAVVGHVLVAGP